MRSLLITPEDEITINFVIAVTKKGGIVVDENEEILKQTYGEALDETSFEKHQAVFRFPSFGDMVSIAGRVSTTDGIGVEFSPLALRLTRMATLLKNWSLQDNGEPIPPTRESLVQLSPVVANLIGMQLDIQIGGM